MAMLEVRDLEVYYGVIQAIKGISFDVNQGEIVALIGANGAGKTTTLHTITGLISAKTGKIVYEGTDITRVSGYKLVGMGIAHVPEGRRVRHPYGASEPEDGSLYKKRQGRDRVHAEDDIPAFPASKGAQEPACRNPVRRRAADACHGKGPYEPSQDDCYG